MTPTEKIQLRWYCIKIIVIAVALFFAAGLAAWGLLSFLTAIPSNRAFFVVPVFAVVGLIEGSLRAFKVYKLMMR